MSDTPTTPKKKSGLLFAVLVVAALVAISVAYLLASVPTDSTVIEDETAASTTEVAPEEEIQITEEIPAVDDTAQPVEATEEATSNETAPPVETTTSAGGFDLAAIRAERVLGNTSAPIKINEYASLTCSHCAHFHKESLAGVKAELVDTGKAYIVFSDFPLNAPAMHASMTARCIPQDKYFDFIGELFAKQDDWAFDSNYMSYLKVKAGEYGLDEERFKACVNDKDIQEAITSRMSAAQKMWGIQSTPSFVVNNKTVIDGALPPAEFIKKVNEVVSAPASQGATEPAQNPNEVAPAAE